MASSRSLFVRADYLLNFLLKLNRHPHEPDPLATAHGFRSHEGMFTKQRRGLRRSIPTV